MQRINESRLTAIAVIATLVLIILLGGKWVLADSIFETNGQSQLQIAKAGPSVSPPNEPIDYRVWVKNSSAITMTNIIVTDVVPTGATYLSASGNGTLINGAVVWTSAEISPGETQEFNFSVTATDDIANVDYRATADGDLLAIGATAVETEILPGASMALSKTGPESVEENEAISYTLFLTNTGSSDLTDIVVTDEIPTGATYVEGSGGTSDGSTVSWNLDDLAIGAVANFNFQVIASSDVTNNSYQATASDGTTVVGQNAVTTQVDTTSELDINVYLPYVGRTRHESEPNNSCVEAYEIGVNADIQGWRNDQMDWYTVDLSDMPAGSTATFAVRDFAINGQIIVYEGEDCTDLAPGINNGDFVRDKEVVIPNANPTRYYILTFVDSEPTFVFPYFVNVTYAP